LWREAAAMRAAPHNLVKLRRVSTTPRIALVAGANGLVGSCLLQVLIEAPEYTRIYALTRRPLGREHAKLANRIVSFTRLAEQLKGLSAQDAYCCIGTTIRDAGSEDAFRDTDVEAVLRFAEAARTAGATRFAVVSSVGAATDSKKFYLRCKGEMEEGVTRLGFPAVDIFQPSLLLGPRKQARPLETLGKLLAPAVNPLLTGARESWRAIPALTVARGMLGATRRGGRGVYRHTYAAICQLAEIKPVLAAASHSAKKGPA